MDNKISVKTIIKELKTSGFALNCKMPMGYADGLPVLQIRNGSLCLLIPYLKYQTTGVVDKTLVYPIRYTITTEIPSGKIVGYEDLSFNPVFEKVDFTKPVGLFRHESIKNLTKNEYTAKRDELLALYDKVANAIIYGSEYSEQEEASMCELLRLLIEPSLLPIYRVLDKDFYNKYLG